MATAQTLTVLNRHESLYFADGDLVVSAEEVDTANARRLFRVHTEILSRHSPVFGDMMAFPPGTETYDGVPLVSLSDKAEDVAALFDTFYKPGYPLLKHNDPDFAVHAYGLMDIARKYQVDTLGAALAHHLEQEWPRSAADLRTFLARRAQLEDAFLDDASGTVPPAWRQGPEPASAIRFALEFRVPAVLPASAIRFALEFRVPAVLPAAFYVLATGDPGDVWPDAHDLSVHARHPARWAQLGPEAMAKFYQGKHALLRALEHVRVRPRTDGDWVFTPVCTGKAYNFEGAPDAEERRELEESFRTPCNYAAWKYSNKCAEELKAARDYVRRADPMLAMMRLAREPDKWGLCPACERDAMERLHKNMRDLWDELPQMFALV